MTISALDVARAAFPVSGGSAAVLVTDPDRLAAACAAVRAEIEVFDRACSRLRTDSQLSRINAAAGRPVPVDALFAEALEVALRAARLTGGAVAPTRAAPDASGSLSAIANPTTNVTLPAPAPGWQSITWDRRRRLVCIPPGTALDFSATAKALAADRAAYAAHLAGDCGVLVNLGGCVAVCGPAPEGGWSIRVPGHGDGAGEGGDQAGEAAAGHPSSMVGLSEGGLATSSAAIRRCAVPNPLLPARSRWRSVSVAAISCVDANIAAMAAILRGDCAAHWLSELRLPARLVRDDGSVLTLDGWPAASDCSS